MISFVFNFFIKKLFWGKSLLWKIFFETLSVFFTLTIIFYASESFVLKSAVQNSESHSLFVFLLVGEIALVLPMSFAERMIAHFVEIRSTQFYQTLLGLRISPLRFVFSKSLVDLLFPLIRLNLILAFSFFALNFQFSILGIVAFYILELFALVIFGLMASVTTFLYLKFNKGIGLFYTLQTFAAIVGGAYFPISVFPGLLKNFSSFLPQTQILKGARLLLQEQNIQSEIYPIFLFWFLLLCSLWFLLDKFLLIQLKKEARYF